MEIPLEILGEKIPPKVSPWIYYSSMENLELSGETWRNMEKCWMNGDTHLICIESYVMADRTGHDQGMTVLTPQNLGAVSG